MVLVSSASSLVISRARHFVFYNFLSVFVFGLIYYVLQYIDGQTFVSNRAIQDQHTTHYLDSQTHSQKHFPLIACMHFSLVTQSTIGYGGMIPLSKPCIVVNSIQLMMIFWITATLIQ